VAVAAQEDVVVPERQDVVVPERQEPRQESEMRKLVVELLGKVANWAGCPQWQLELGCQQAQRHSESVTSSKDSLPLTRMTSTSSKDLLQAARKSSSQVL